MKLKISLFLAVATLATIAVARDANVFASGLKATKGDGTKYNFSYTLNVPAQSVSINIYRGNTLAKSINSTKKAKGKNTITVDLAGLSGEYS